MRNNSNRRLRTPPYDVVLLEDGSRCGCLQVKERVMWLGRFEPLRLGRGTCVVRPISLYVCQHKKRVKKTLDPPIAKCQHDTLCERCGTRNGQYSIQTLAWLSPVVLRESTSTVVVPPPEDGFVKRRNSRNQDDCSQRMI